MKQALALAFLTVIGCSRQSASLNTVGGHPTNAPEHGFAVAIVDAKSHEQFCSGSLVAPRIVITAGHCVSSLNTYLQPTERLPNEIMVHFGTGNLTKIHDGLVKVAKVAVAPQHVSHRDKLHEGDVAYLTLAEPAPASIKPVDVMLDQEKLAKHLHKGMPTQVIGFGCTDESISCSKGKKTIVDVMINEVGPLIVDAGAPKKSAMQGDSGGSLVVQTPEGLQLIGVVSGVGRVQGAYSLVYPYACWINETSSINLPDAKDHCEDSASEELRDFVEICKTPKSAYQKRSVEILLRRVQAKDCLEGAERLTKIENLVLDGELIHDVSPMISMSHLKTLSIHENALTDILPLAKLPSLNSISIDLAQLKHGQVIELNRLRPGLKFVSEDLDSLMMAGVDQNNIELVKALAGSISDWEKPAKDGESYFLRAVRKHHREIAETILVYGANINGRNLGTMSSAVVYAAIDDSPEWLQWLIDRGADACLKNKFDETALVVAKRVNADKAVKTLSAIRCDN